VGCRSAARVRARVPGTNFTARKFMGVEAAYDGSGERGTSSDANNVFEYALVRAALWRQQRATVARVRDTYELMFVPRAVVAAQVAALHAPIAGGGATSVVPAPTALVAATAAVTPAAAARGNVGAAPAARRGSVVAVSPAREGAAAVPPARGGSPAVPPSPHGYEDVIAPFRVDAGLGVCGKCRVTFCCVHIFFARAWLMLVCDFKPVWNAVSQADLDRVFGPRQWHQLAYALGVKLSKVVNEHLGDAPLLLTESVRVGDALAVGGVAPAAAASPAHAVVSGLDAHITNLATQLTVAKFHRRQIMSGKNRLDKWTAAWEFLVSSGVASGPMPALHEPVPTGLAAARSALYGLDATGRHLVTAAQRTDPHGGPAAAAAAPGARGEATAGAAETDADAGAGVGAPRRRKRARADATPS
jgi:hypothetical protein